MTRVHGRVEGVRELRKQLRAAGDDLSDLKDANKRTGELIAGAGRGRAPARTGRLVASVRPARVASGVVIRAGSRTVPYAGPIHWGTGSRRGRPSNIRPQPFLADAAAATEDTWVAYYFDELQRVIDHVRGAE